MNFLRIRLVDDAGQTFQFDGPRLDWTDWRWVVFDLLNPGTHSHWGGPNDGVVRPPLRLDTLLLLDSTRDASSGTLYFAHPAVAIEVR
jgi:hypothetical protein